MPVLSKYDVLDEIGHGGMATVYRAHDKRLGRDVAIKVLHPHLRDSREIAHRFSVEAKAVAKLRHPNIVEVFDVSSEEDNEQYLVVELVRGPTLRKILQDRGAMPPEIGACFVVELLSGIAHAHASGVIHRDVKPENVLVEHRPKGGSGSNGDESLVPSGEREGERVRVKLTDFGIAKLLDAQGVTSTGQVLGSPAHMAPEQIEGGDVDGRADVFGLGVLLYECLVGHLPFLGNNPAQVLRRVLDGVFVPAEREQPTVGKVWSQIIDRALAREAAQRYPDAPSMRDALTVELERLGMAAPRSEIEAWLDDPERWTAEHHHRLVERLCELGSSSRKRGDAVAAASDYNRALAYAPNDPSLLHIVTSMHRSEARARFLLRFGPLALGAIVLGSGAYAVAKAFQTLPKGVAEPSSDRNARPALEIPSAPLALTSTAPSALVVVSPPSTAVTRTIAAPVVVPSKSGVQRSVKFVTLKPDFGVHMTIDGVPAPDPDPTKSFTLDERAHSLAFTCAEDLCAPKTIVIAAGEKSEALTVELSIPPAKLVVEGEPSHPYGIDEMVNVTLVAGQETDIPMSGKNRSVTVFDRLDTSKRHVVKLWAGKRASVSFNIR